MSAPIRLVLDTVVLALLGLGGSAIGWNMAPSLVSSTCEAAGITDVVVQDPSEVAATYGELAVALALAPAVAWVAVLLHFALTRRPAPWWVPLVVLVADLAFVALGVGWQASWLVRAALPDGAGSGVMPMFSLGGLDLGAAGVRLGLVGALPAWAATAWLARRRARPSETTST